MSDVPSTINASIWDDTTTYSGVVDANGLHTVGDAIGTGSWYPIYLDDIGLGDVASLRVDQAGNLVCRSAVLTDEGSFYEPFAGVALGADWTKITGTGTSVAVANSLCTLTLGTTALSQCAIYRTTDFPPLIFTFALTVSQRIANQDIYFGSGNHPTDPTLDTQFMRFHFTGTDNTKIRCEVQSSADTGGNDGTTTDYILPNGFTTAQKLLYRIEYTARRITFSVGLEADSLIKIVAYSIQRPDPYEVMYQRVRAVNGTTPASSTTIAVDAAQSADFNLLDTRAQVTGDVAVVQNVTASTVNSSTANLLAGATFTGKTESTLGIAGIQCSIKTDQNGTLYVDQSPDGINWDIVDAYTVLAGTGFATTTQAVNSYYRVRFTNNGGSATTYLRMQTALCPIVEALPRSLNANGNLRVAINEAIPADNQWQVQTNAGKGYVATSGLIAVSGTGEADFILIKNPVGSGKTIRIWQIVHAIDETTGTARYTMKIYRDPTVTTNGTTMAINNVLKSGGATAMNAYTAPTTSAPGTLLVTREGSQLIVPLDMDLGMYIQPNETMLITVKNQASGYLHLMTIFWLEV